MVRVASTVLCLGFLLTASAAWADEGKIDLDKLPKAVVDAVKAKYPDAKMVGAEKETTGDKTVYEVVVKNKGQDIEIVLTPEGKIVEEEKELPVKDLPRVVAQAIEKKYSKGTIKSIEESTKDEKATYGVLLENDIVVGKEKQKVRLHLNAEGTIIRTQKLIAAEDLPKAVAGSLDKKYPKAAITRVNELAQEGKVTYMVYLETAEKKIGALLDEEGKIVKEQSKDKEKK
jgi:Putative beta-lactamase-inhibitor-like, PepSY-like